MQGCKLYVGNLPYSTSKEQLIELFSNHGDVKEVEIIEDRGIGFVVMASSEEAEKAKAALHGTEYEGRTLRVDDFRPPKTRRNRDYRRY